MLKSYEQLRKIDVSPYCDKRDGYLYLNWAKCIDMLRQNGAEDVRFEVIPNPRTGGSLYESETEFTDKSGNTNKNYETRIKVIIDDREYIMHSPVMNGTNPVKDNSMSQQRTWNSMTRSFVKCVAINTGLGFDLWLKEERKTFETPLYDDDAKPTLATLTAIRKVGEQLGVNVKRWAAMEGKTLETLTADEAGKMLRALNEEKEKRGLK